MFIRCKIKKTPETIENLLEIRKSTEKRLNLEIRAAFMRTLLSGMVY